MKRVSIHQCLWTAGLLCALFAASAQAAPVTFQVGEGDGARRATVESATQNGVAYVPLGSLVRQLGGQAQVTPQRATLDFGGYAALIDTGGTLVSGSLQQFSLTKPVLESGGEAWVALDDVAPLFRQAFGTGVAQSGQPAPTAEDASPAEDELLEEVTAEPAPGAPPAPAPEAQPHVVVIDPGHGGTEIGAKGQSLEEKAMTLDLAQRVANALESGPGGLRAYLTRTDDSALPVLDRVNAAIQHGDVFISLHGGAALAPGVAGVEIFFPSDDVTGESESGGMNAAQQVRIAQAGRALAEAVSGALTAREGVVLAGSHAVKSPLLQHVPMPAILVEAGYLTNAEDEAALGNGEHLERLAQGIAEGVQRYLGVAAAPAEVPVQ